MFGAGPHAATAVDTAGGAPAAPRPRHAASPRAVGLATALAVAATITASALPTSVHGRGRRPRADPVRHRRPGPGGAPVRWTPVSAVVPVDRVAASLGEGADAARRRTAALPSDFVLPGRPAAQGTAPPPSPPPSGPRPTFRPGARPRTTTPVATVTTITDTATAITDHRSRHPRVGPFRSASPYVSARECHAWAVDVNDLTDPERDIRAPLRTDSRASSYGLAQTR